MESPELFAILPAASGASSRRSTKHNTGSEGGGTVSAVDCEGRRHTNTTLSPKTYRSSKQAHSRWIEHTLLPSPTQTRLNACQLQSLHDLLCTSSPYNRSFNAQHTHVLSQLQIAAGRACDVIYSLFRVSSPWPALLAMTLMQQVPSAETQGFFVQTFRSSFLVSWRIWTNDRSLEI